MALIPDYEPDDELKPDRPRSGAALGSAGVGAPSAAQPQGASTTAPQGNEFVPWGRFVSANKEVSDREAGRLAGGVRSSAEGVAERRDAASKAQAAGVESNYQTTPVEPVDARTNQAPSAFGGNATAFSSAQPSAQPSTQPDSLTALPQVNQKRELADLNADGASNLEEQIGAPAWASLIGDTAKAQQAATALGSQAGVQGLIQRQGLSPNSAFDAALIGGAGGKDFRDISKKYGGTQLTDALLGANQSAVDRWQSLIGDIDAARGVENSSDGGAPGDQPEEFVVSPYATDTASMIDWIEKALKTPGGGDYLKLLEWASQIYGGADNGTLLQRLHADLQKMTWSEFDALRNGRVPAWMGQGDKSAGFKGFGESAAVAKVREIRQQVQKGFDAMSSAALGKRGSVNTLGTRDQFLDAYAGDKNFGDGINWGQSPSVRQQAETAARALGMSPENLINAIKRMTADEYQNFWLLGVIPEWMDVAGGFGKGKVGGWQSPFLESVMKYGNDGGMWNAITNMWKDSAIKGAGAAAGGGVGIAGLGVTTAAKAGGL